MTAAITLNQKSGKFEFRALGGKVYSSANRNYIEYRYKQAFGDGNKTTNDTATTEQMVAEEKFGINERFEFIENFVTMVADKVQPSMIVSGDGGLGKSFVVEKILKREGLINVTNVESFIEGDRLPSKRFRIIKGYSTPKALYRTLYENKDSIIVIDDCDNVLRDPVATNLLKGALDSNSERIICWNAETKGDDDLPCAFRFQGGVIFITNLSKEKLPQALCTRSICVDVSMTLTEKVQRMSKIVFDDDFMPEVDRSTKELSISVIDQYKDRAREVSMRTLIQVIRIAQKFSGAKFQDMAKYAMVN